MVVRFRKKIRKKRGTKTCGYGMKKKHRGGGSRGGRGKAGYGKHKFTKMLKLEPEHFGKRGFNPVRRKKLPCVNVSQLERMEESGRVVFNGKILGRGQIKKPLTVVCANVSRIAREKIERAGGRIEAGTDEENQEVVEK